MHPVAISPFLCEDEKMSENEIYYFHNGNAYLRVEPASYHREMQDLLLAIQLGEEKIASLREKIKTLDQNSDAYDSFADAINDIGFMIDDFTIRHEQLRNIPDHR